MSLNANLSSFPTNGLKSSLFEAIKGSFNILIANQDLPDNIVDLGYLDDVVIKPVETTAEISSQNRGLIGDVFVTDLSFEITCAMFEYSYQFLKTTLEGSLVFDTKASQTQTPCSQTVANLTAGVFCPMDNQDIALQKPTITSVKKDNSNSPTDITSSEYDIIQASGVWGIVLKSDASDVLIEYTVDTASSKQIYFTSSGKRPKLMLLAYQKERSSNGKTKARGFRFLNVSLTSIPTITAKSVKDTDSIIRFPLTFKATVSPNPITITNDSGDIVLDNVVCQYVEEEV